MNESSRIMGNCATNPYWNGTCSREEVNEILSHGDTVICNGHLREFEFTMITPETYKFKTVDWYDKKHNRPD
jgi:hypothetical protein